MKVTYMEGPKSKKNDTVKKQPAKPRLPEFFLSATDLEALRFAQERHLIEWYYKAPVSFIPYFDIKYLLEDPDRKKIKDLNITPNEPHTDTYIIFQFGEELYQELSKEAADIGVNINDYIRGIVYTMLMSLNQAKRKADLELEAYKRDHREIPVNFYIEKELRNKLEKKFGRREDDDYSALAYKILEEAAEGKSKNKAV